MTITLIADDLTGACDAGAHFTGRGRVRVFVDEAPVDPGRDVAVVDTESRALSPEDAGRRVRAATRRLGARRCEGFLFKKIDSTLRGPIAAEVEALLDEAGRGTALVCPTFPAQGRTVTGGLLHLGGRPAHTSVIARDPAYPGDTSDVGEILRRGATRTVRHLPLTSVRGGGNALASALARAREAIVTADAETDADLDALAAAAIAAPDVVLAGSAGLARAAAQCLGYAGPRVPIPDGHAWLVIAGSLHPATRAQIRALDAAGIAGATVDLVGEPDVRTLAARLGEGRPVFLTTAESETATPEARPRMAAALAAAALRVLELSSPDVVAVTGGDTARALMRALGTDRLDLAGAPSSGLALGELVTSAAPSFTWLSKAGGFGAPDLFLALLEGKA